jgi:hypothetical protein
LKKRAPASIVGEVISLFWREEQEERADHVLIRNLFLESQTSSGKTQLDMLAEGWNFEEACLQCVMRRRETEQCEAYLYPQC